MPPKKRDAEPDFVKPRKGSKHKVPDDLNDLPNIASGMTVKVADTTEDRVLVEIQEEGMAVTEDGLVATSLTRVIALTHDEFKKVSK